MPKTARQLTAAEVRRIDEPGLHAVGGQPGLYVQVSRARSRSWVLRVRIAGKTRDMGLGGYPEVSLADAREAAKQARDLIRAGKDPIEERKRAKAALAATRAKQLSFREAAERCFDAKQLNWKSTTHKRDWMNSLRRHAFPVIGSMDVGEIELPHVLRALEQVWTAKPATATSVRQRIELVLSWATVRGYREGPNPAAWEGNLKELLPDPSKFHKVSHLRALPWQDVPVFVEKLRQREGIAARALELIVLTASRSGEVRKAVWSEFDLQERTWTIPAERMKGGRAHTVPLCDDAVALLKGLPRDGDLLFPNQRGGKPLSDMALRRVLDDMGVDATVHGFRSSFKSWAQTRSKYQDEVSELQLAHINSDRTRSAYARNELLPQRRRLMADWAKFLREGAGEANDNNVTAIGAGAEVQDG